MQSLATAPRSIPYALHAPAGGVLFDSFPKSGTYLFWRICRALQQAAGTYRSYAAVTGLADLLAEFIPAEDQLFAHYTEIDHVYPHGDRWHFYVHHPMRRIHVDTDLLRANASLLWLHEPPSTLGELGEGRTCFYLMRDGRAVVNSFVHHLTRPSVRATHPTYTIENPLELYARKEVFRVYVRRWRDHVQDHLDHAAGWHLVRFEDLTGDMPREIARIASLLGVEADAEALADEFSFRRMKSDSPLHVRAGTDDDWRRYFDAEHVDIFKQEAGELLVRLGYTPDLDW